MLAWCGAVAQGFDFRSERMGEVRIVVLISLVWIFNKTRTTAKIEIVKHKSYITSGRFEATFDDAHESI